MADIPEGDTPSTPQHIRGAGGLVAGSSNIAGAGVVVSGQHLNTTQLALGQDVFYQPRPIFALERADFHILVNPPPKQHQWLTTARSAFLGTLLVALGSWVQALVTHTVQNTFPIAATVAWVIASAVLAFIHKLASREIDPKQELIERIRRTWDKPKA